MTYIGLAIVVALVAWYAWEKSRRKTHPMEGGLHEDISLPYEQEYELYHNDLSLCSKKVRVCMAELGLPYKAHHIELIETGSYETISRHFLKVNPAGVLPVLVHNGHPVYESHDIISYAAAQAGDGAPMLVPADREHRALMQKWKDLASMVGDDPTDDLAKSAAGCVGVLSVPLFAAGMVVIPYRHVFEGLLFHRIKFRPFMFLIMKVVGLKGVLNVKKVKNKLDAAKAALCNHFAALNELLSDGRPWIVGQQYTLADISWMVLFDRLMEADSIEYFLSGNTYPYVQTYWQRLRARPSYQEGVDGFRHPLVADATRRIQAQKATDPRFAEAMAMGCPANA